MFLLGQVNTLQASRRSDPGYYLVDDEDNEVLLPNKYVPDNLKAGKSIEVFLYKDSEDRWVATTIYPVVMLYGYFGILISHTLVFMKSLITILLPSGVN